MTKNNEIIKNNIDKCLIFDIETSAVYPNGNKINIRTQFDDYIKYAKVKWIGFYSYKYNKYFLYDINKDKNKIIKLFELHETIIGFNNKKFDTPICVNNELFKNKIELDIQEILGNDYSKGHKNRSIYMGVKLKPVIINNKEYGANSLMSMAYHFGLDTLKGDIDYNIFYKNTWSSDEVKQIKKYLKQDVKITKQLFDKLIDFWTIFTDWLYIEDINNWNWLKASIASLTYCAACKVKGVKVEYGEHIKLKEEMGGRAIQPIKEEIYGVHYLDEASKYPHIFAQFNLFNEVDVTGWSKEMINDALKNNKLFHGNFMFKVKGYYDITKQGVLEKDVLNKIRTRNIVKQILKKYKQGVTVLEKIPDELKDFIHSKQLNDEIIEKLNGLQYCIKIFINALYGAVRSPVFKQIYTKNAGYDCCWIGQQIHKKVDDFFQQKGYNVVGGFTDSWFIEAKPNDSKEIMINYSNEIMNNLKQYFIFPSITHIIDYETYMDYLLYDKDENTDLFKKNNYVFISNNKIKIVGFPIKKSNATKLSKLIFDKYLVKEGLKINRLKFTKKWLKQLIIKELENDISLIATEFKCKEYKYYKNSNQIQAQVSKHYLDGLSGNIKLIKNIKIGKIGMSMKYCSIEEAKKYNLTINDVDLTKVWNELKPFIIKKKKRDLFNFNEVNKND